MNTNNELSHVGVLGMKWGHRKDSSSSPTSSSGRKMTSSKPTPSEAEIKQHRIATAKKVAIIGGAAVATGLAVYGTYKLSKFVKGHSEEIKAAKDLVGFMASKGKSSKDTVRQVPLKPMSNATRKKAERPSRVINPELRSKIRKELLETNPVYRDLIKEQVEHELKYGPPTAAQMARAKETLIREGVKFPFL